MKKKIMTVIASLLCAAMLCSCAAVGTPAVAALSREEDFFTGLEGFFGWLFSDDSEYYYGEEEEFDTVRFSDMEYISPDIDLIAEHVDKAIEDLEANASYSAICEDIELCLADYDDFITAYSLAEIHSLLDLTDDYWAEEYEMCMEYSADVESLFDELYYSCAASKNAAKLENDCFWEGFCEDYSDPEESIYNDKTVELFKKEAGLLSEYYSITASTIVEYKGEEWDYNELLEECSDDEYYDAFMSYYNTYNEELSNIYIELVKVRRQLAEAAGYDSYCEMQYEELYRRDYSPKDAERFIADVREYAVPLFAEMEPMIEEYLLEEEDLIDIVSSAAYCIGESIGDTYEFLEAGELFDVSYGSGKAEMAFTSYIENYDAPFVFVAPSGTESDIIAFTHELGHATDEWYNYNADASLDLMEVFSQGLELLLPAYMYELLDDETIDYLYRFTLWRMLQAYAQQSSFAEFENCVYALSDEELTAENLNALSLRLAEDYGYLEPGYEDFYALSWPDIEHFFESPFYVISYPVSCTVALQIFELELEEPGAGLEKYLELLPRESEYIIESAESVGLESPFAEGRVKRAVSVIESYLDTSYETSLSA